MQTVSVSKGSPTVTFVGARSYDHTSKACDITRDVLSAAGLEGIWTLTLETKVRSRGPTRFKLRSGVGSRLYVVIKPGDQDSAAKFHLAAPAGVSAARAYTQLRQYLDSQRDPAEPSEPDEDVDAVSLPPVATPIRVPPAAGGSPDVLGQLVHLQQQVEQMRFNRDASRDLSQTINDLRDRRTLLDLELREVSSRLQQAERDLQELPQVTDQEFAATEARWKSVEQALQMLQAAITQPA